MQDLNIKKWHITHTAWYLMLCSLASNSRRLYLFKIKMHSHSCKRDRFCGAERALAWWDKSQFSSQLSQYKTSLRDMTIGTDIVPIAGDAVPEGWGVLLDSYSFCQTSASQFTQTKSLSRGDQRRRHSERHNQYVFFRAQQSKGTLRLRSLNDLFLIQHWYHFSQII